MSSLPPTLKIKLLLKYINSLSTGADKEIDSVWQKLTPLEQKEFEETVKTGRIGHLITVHTPWWEVSRSDNHS